ncbi:MAG: sulfatase-like hydrolase/transferase [Verrucomicrobiota bacterium]
MVKLALILFHIFLVIASVYADATKPNVILILTDDLGWGDLAVSGHPYVQTPNLDRMAQGGTVFNQFYTSSPVCSPTRATFQTGHYPARYSIHSAFDGRHKGADAMPSFLEPTAKQVSRMVRDNGYATAHYGKWHLSDAPKKHNFEVPNLSFYGFDDFRTYHTYFGGVDRKHHFVRGGDEHYRAKSSQAIVDETLEFMRKNPGEPVYINAWTLIPHAKLNPTPEQLAVYANIDPDPADFPKHMREYLETIPPEELKERMQIYCAAVTGLDSAVGNLLDGIKEMGKEQETFIFFTSDNGPEDNFSGTTRAGVGSPGELRGRKRSIYEGGVRTSAIAYWPGTVPAGQVNDTSIIAAVDWFPTVCALTGTAIDGLNLDGEDITDILKGANRQRNKPIFWEWRFKVRGPETYSPPQLAVREGDWKLFMNPDGTKVELYHIPDDPQELSNVADKYHERVETMKATLLQWKGSLPTAPAVSSYVHDAEATPYRYGKR